MKQPIKKETEVKISASLIIWLVVGAVILLLTIILIGVRMRASAGHSDGIIIDKEPPKQVEKKTEAQPSQDSQQLTDNAVPDATMAFATATMKWIPIMMVVMIVFSIVGTVFKSRY